MSPAPKSRPLIPNAALPATRTTPLAAAGGAFHALHSVTPTPQRHQRPSALAPYHTIRATGVARHRWRAGGGWRAARGAGLAGGAFLRSATRGIFLNSLLDAYQILTHYL